MQKNIVTRFLVCLAACLVMLPATGQQKNGASRQGGRTTAVEALLQSAKNQRAHQGSALGVKGRRQQGFKPFGQALRKYGRSFVPPMMRSSAGLSSPRAASAYDGTELWGVVIARDSWKEMESYDRPYGVYKLSSGSAEWTAMTTDSYSFDINAGGAFIDEWFVGCNAYSYDGTFYYNSSSAWNTETWEKDYDHYYNTSQDQGSVAYATAFDPTDKKVYAFLWGGDATAMNFGTIDYSDLSYSVAGKAERLYVALAIDASGRAFAIGLDGSLYKIDKASGASTLVGSTGVKPSQVLQSATFDLAGGTMYWAAVAEDGSSALYTVDTASGKATKKMDFADGDEIVCLYAPQQSSPKVPSAATNLTADFAKGSLTGTVAFDIPGTCSDGTELKGNVDYTVYDATNVVAKGTAEAGTTVRTDVTLASNGEHTIAVILKNSHGESKKATLTTPFLGNDEPNAPDEVTLAISPEGHVRITWNAVTTGFNEGYVDPEQMTYTVTRGSDGKTVAENLKTTTFEEDIDVSGTYAAYSYTVTPTCAGLTSPWGTRSNLIKTGKAFEVPYKDDFTDYSAFDLYDRVNKGRSRGWIYADRNVGSSFSYQDTEKADAWLVTPPIALKDGRAYYLKFKASASDYDDNDFTETFSAAFGEGSDPTIYAEAVGPTNISKGESRAIEQLVNIDKAGDYRFAIHDTSTPVKGAYNQSLFVDDLEVVAGPLYTAPDSVASLTAKAAAKGEHRATLTFNAPTLTFRKNPLATLTKVEVACDGQLVYTFAAAKPGQRLTCDISGESLTDGFHTFTVTAWNADGAGLKRDIKAYIGIDTPTLISNLDIKDNLDGTATMTWDPAPTVGQHGGYVNPEALTYNIYVPGDETMDFLAKADKRSYTIENLPQTGAQGLAGYAVAPVSVAGEGYMTLGTIAYGENYKLPFHEGFPGGEATNTPWITTSSGNGTWGTYDSMSSDGDGGCIGFIPGAASDSATVATGKIALGTGGKPKLVFSYYALNGYKAQLTVRIGRNGGRPTDVVKLIDMSGSNIYGWQRVVADLSKYTGEGYANIYFCARAAEGAPVIIDDISVKDFSATGVSAMLKAPTRLNVGSNGTFTVGLSNVGTSNADGVEVTLYKGSQPVDTVRTDVPVYSQKEVALHYKPLPTDGEKLEFHAVASFGPDDDLSDNTTDTATVTLVRSELPSVTGLRGSADADGAASLEWTAPDLKDGTVTDGFETYKAFAIEGVGAWTLIDGDGQETTSISGASSFEHSFEPYAYIVFNPAEAGLKLDNLPQYGAHTGEQYMAAFECNYNNPPYHNDDWLVSPQLSGKTQTVSFFAKSVDNEYSYESFEVLYTTGEASDTASYVKVGGAVDIADEWKEYSYNLPEGATHFAIRCITKAGFIFMVDDVTYQGIAPKLTGYNIYRDGRLAASIPATSTGYTDREAPAGEHTYAVTAVYDEGESALSNSVSVSTTATSIDATGAERLSVAGGLGTVSVRGGNGQTMRLYTTGGSVVTTVVCSATTVVPAQRGQYIVRIAGRSFNISVR